MSEHNRLRGCRSFTGHSCDCRPEPLPAVFDDDTPTLCAECRHWGGEPDSFALGPCLVSGSFRAPGGLFTERDFGCTHGRKS